MSEVQSTVEYRLVPGFTCYRVGNDGSVWTNKHREDWVRLRQETCSGYLRVSLSQKHLLVHRLVLEAFVGPCPKGMEACHGDGCRTNNFLSNLRWDTRAGNVRDTIQHGTYKRGEKQWQAKVTEELVRQIRFEYDTGQGGLSSLGRKHGLHHSSIWYIVTRRTWRHIV